jgi:FkbM family methyltransferase
MATETKERDWRLCGMDPSAIPKVSLDFLSDIRSRLPRATVRTVFDVGANVGEYSARVAAAFPEAEIFCFEPTTATFAVCKGEFAARPNVHCFQLALGAEAGSGQLLLEPSAVSNRLVDAGAYPGRSFEAVPVGTIDGFCAERGIAAIDLLKIDTEGHDLAVLRGAERMLGALSVKLVQVEAGMHGHNRLHVPLQDFREYLEPRGYLLFGIYNQALEMKQPNLRRCDPVFIAGTLVEAHRATTGPP